MCLGSFFEYENVLILGTESGNLRILRGAEVVEEWFILHNRSWNYWKQKEGRYKPFLCQTSQTLEEMS